MLMDQVDTLHVGRYLSEVLSCIITTHMGDLEIKVTDLKILCLSFGFKFCNEIGETTVMYGLFVKAILVIDKKSYCLYF